MASTKPKTSTALPILYEISQADVDAYEEKSLILAAVRYDDMPSLTTRVAVKQGEGSSARWVAVDRKSTDYHASCCRVTKNLSGPQLDFLAKSPGLVDVESDGGEHLGIGTSHTGLSTSRTHTEAQATLSLVGGHAAGIDFNVGAGISTGAGLKDDSVSIKVLGCGIIFGRKIGLSFFDNTLAVDLGKVLDAVRREGEGEDADFLDDGETPVASRAAALPRAPPSDYDGYYDGGYYDGYGYGGSRYSQNSQSQYYSDAYDRPARHAASGPPPPSQPPPPKKPIYPKLDPVPPPAAAMARDEPLADDQPDNAAKGWAKRLSQIGSFHI